MNKWQRIEKLIEGGKPDRTPVSAWRHFFREEDKPETLAAVMLRFQKTLDWDFMKVNARADYHAEPWGNRYESDPQTGKPKLEHSVVAGGNWDAIRRLPPDRGALGEHLDALKMIKAEIEPDTPFVMTVFSPLSVAVRLAGGEEPVAELMRKQPEQLHAVLKNISSTFADFADACLYSGAWGLFFATTVVASTEFMTREEYREFGRPYDLRVLEATEDARLNVLHVCRSNNMLLDLLDYPVHVVNWDWLDKTNPKPADVLGKTALPLAGGVSGDAPAASDASQVLEEAATARSAVPPDRLILAGTCTVSVDSRTENLHAMRRAVEA